MEQEQLQYWEVLILAVLQVMVLDGTKQILVQICRIQIMQLLDLLDQTLEPHMVDNSY